MNSAMATAASFPLATAIHLIMVSTVCISPSSRNTWEPPIDWAWALVITSSSSLMSPLSKASKIRSIVIILVILAGEQEASAFCSYMTVPVDASIKMAEGAEMDTGAPSWAYPFISGIPIRHMTSMKEISFFAIAFCFTQFIRETPLHISSITHFMYVRGDYSWSVL